MKQKLTFLFVSCLFFVSFSFAQEITVQGTVSDASTGELPGVNIQVKGTKKGTTTGFDGKYSIKTSKGSVLVFSYIGYKTKEVTVTSNTINVTMVEDADLLDEIVVTSFGIKKKEKSLGYAVQKVKAADLNLAGNTNALEALQGQVAGVQITRTSGSAGGGVDILIRGISSVNPGRSNQPLIVVDGIALNNDTFAGNTQPSAGSNASGSSEQFGFSNRAGDINPDDIESYSVLKGAAATALYGIRASNGAIIITTKKGKLGKAKISIGASTTLRQVTKTPALQTTFREGHRTTRRPGVTIDPTNTFDGYNRFSWAFYSWGVPFTDDEFVQFDGTITDLRNDAFHSPYELFKTGVNTQFNFNISGASDKLNYYFSAGKSSDEGILPNTYYDKINLKFRGGLQISDKFNVNTSIIYTKSGGARGNGGDKSIFSSMSYWSATFPINDYLNSDGTQKNYTPGWIDNPRYFAETSNLKDNVNRWVANATLNWSPKEWLNISYSAQIDNYSDIRNRFVPADLDVGTQVGGFIINENINFTGLESNLLATITKDFSEDFKATVLIGNQISDISTNYSNIRGEGLNIPGLNDLSNITNIFAGLSKSHSRSMGIFSEVRLAYQDKLFLSVTGRNDWLSVLPAKNRSFFYPSVSMSYLFHELIDQDANILSFGKFRTSWAQVGKGPNFGQIGQFFINDGVFPFDGTGGYRASTRAGDPDLIPERSSSYEIGTDLRFLNNRFRLDYSYYKTKNTDQIFPVSTAQSSGISSYIRNAGDYETWGHELLLSADIIKKENFKWTAIINWSTNGGKVTAIPEDLDEIIFFEDRITAKAKVGDALGTLYGWVFQTTPDGQRYVGADGKWIVTGSDNSGFYYTGTNEMVKVGNAFPDYIATINNNFSWKNFDFNFMIEYKKGGDLYDRGFRNALRNGNLKETEFRDQERVLQGVMDDGNGGFTANTTSLLITADSYYRDFDNYNTASEVLLQDGSWLKLRTIGLTYKFNSGLINKLGISRASLNASAHNILLWTPFKGFDPEGNQFSAGSNIYGFTGLTVPLSESYSFGLKLDF